MSDRYVEIVDSKWFVPYNPFACFSVPVEENIFKRERYSQSNPRERRKFLPLALWRPALLSQVRLSVQNEVALFRSRTRTTKGLPSSSLLTYHPLLPYYPYYLETFFGNPLIDRTRTLLQCVKVKVIDPIPELNPNFRMTLHEVCIERAKEIFKISKETNQKIKVLWSAGIDSTAVLVSLLFCGSKPEIDKSNNNLR